MNTFEKIEEKIKNMQDEQIVLHRPNYLIPFLFTLIGIGLIVVCVIDGFISIEWLNNLCMMTGIVLFGIGLYKLYAVFKKGAGYYVYAPTGKKIKSYTVYLNYADKQRMDTFINSNDFSKLSELTKQESSGFMVCLKGTDDGEIFLLQQKEYIPHYFRECSPVVVLRGESAKEMSDFIKN